MTTSAPPAPNPAKPVYDEGAARRANDWWETLPAERRCSIHRWISGGPTPAESDADQLTIDDALGAR